ncbi:MAG TPA: patatin-like phospholipase family protein [Gemmataceae bacterium]|jgi:predicted acylesterase/phospholipase RssA
MNSAKKIGLALSGGGFRASLYHLGLVRFLRDAGILSQVSHITSVSGGSVLAAHLVLNWDRYNGSPGEFDAAAAELLSFVRLDVRNRIVRRWLLAFPLRGLRWFVGGSNRKLARTGLLESYYERFLYGDTTLFELPERPQLHILTTNLSEGCLCSFTRDGLLMVRRQPGGKFRIDRIHTGLATVPMAVAASSAFPGFFPPLVLTGMEVGANVGEFGRQAYTDGAVFDNLGVRMFHFLEGPLLSDTPLSREDFIDFPANVEALRQASQSSEETPLRRLAQLLVGARSRPEPLLLPDVPISGNESLPPQEGEPRRISTASGESLISRLGDILRHYPLHREPLFAALKPVDAETGSLLHASFLRDRVLEPGEQLWLNRHLLEATFRQATGRPCFRRLNGRLDGVLVSDVGKPFEVKSNLHASGLLRTALRATDIVMDRVWQLEVETFHDSPGFVFAPVTDIVDLAEDPTALHPEVQRQAAFIRTDLDRFSMLEISTLARHGYCVGRKACRAHPDLFGAKLPGDAPWDPVPGQSGAPSSVLPAPRATLLPFSRGGRGGKSASWAAASEARTLQASALRRIWGTALDYRDWASYVYVALVVPILILLPYVVVKYYERSRRVSQLVESLSQGSPDLEVMSRLLEGPTKPWVGESAEEVRSLEELNFRGFEVLQDSRILDMRDLNPTAAGELDSNSSVYGYRRLKVFKRADSAGNNLFRIDVLATSPKTQVRFPPQQLRPHLLMSSLENAAPGENQCRWQVSWNFEKVPAGEYIDLIYEHWSPALFLRHEDGLSSVAYPTQVDTAEVNRWFLMPKRKEYKDCRILRYPTGKPEGVEAVKVVSEYLTEDSTILAYKLLSAKAGYTYEVTWFYK